jgi:hypothetical protein
MSDTSPIDTVDTALAGLEEGLKAMKDAMLAAARTIRPTSAAGEQLADFVTGFADGFQSEVDEVVRIRALLARYAELKLIVEREPGSPLPEA